MKRELLILLILSSFIKIAHCETDYSGVHDTEARYLKPNMSFRAELVEYNLRHAQKIKRSNIILSDQGMRAELGHINRENLLIIYIQNYETGQQWLASPKKLCYSKLSTDKAVGESGGSDRVVTPSILDRVPCQGEHGLKRAARMVKGKELSVWECTSEQGRKTMQHYSDLLGLVIRQQSDGGEVRELTDISLMGISERDFMPSSLWREVALDELLFNTPLLPEYIE
ncbi:MAG: hypothetical protein P8179_13795 [Candidatus Thiodiazotropha sp.]